MAGSVRSVTPAKRILDVLVAAALVVILAPILIAIALSIRLLDGAPILYVCERMKSPDEAFRLIKFRTMRPAANDSGVSGGDKSGRITRIGRFLRRARLDELPQLWNVLAGDISLVGPRPPLRTYTERFPELYSRVLRSRPGVTGLASVYFHEHEERLLARSRSAAETDLIYTRSCIPRKARLDLIYQAHRNVCFDVEILLKTVFRGLR